MGQRVFGIDLGAYALKVAELELGFRSATLRTLTTIPLSVGEEAAQWRDRGQELERSIAMIAARVTPSPGDIISWAFPGDRVLNRVFTVPFGDPRKVQPVISAELCDDIPWEESEVVIDFIAPPKSGGPVLVAAAMKEEVATFLEETAASGLNARNLRVSCLTYAGLLKHCYGDEAVVLVDIGHARTNIFSAAEGKPILGRTILRGGRQINEAIAEAFKIGILQAEAVKHERARLVEGKRRGTSETDQELSCVVEDAVRPMIGEIKRTLSLVRTYHLASNKQAIKVDRVVLTGGGAKLKGLSEMLESSLDLPVSSLDLVDHPDLCDGDLAPLAASEGGLALALTLEYGRRSSLDFRRDEFAFKIDRSYLREKSVSIGLSLFAILVFAGLSIWASISSLTRETDALSAQLSAESLRVFGAKMTSPSNISRRVRSGARKLNNEIPRTSAPDILERISASVPQRDALKIDINKMEIKQGKTHLQGTAESRGAVGQIIEALRSVDCFSKVHPGKISEVAGGKKQFTLDLSTKCF